jgi:hypothetical protein
LSGPRGELREDAADLDAGQGRLDLADGAAELGGRGRLGVEGFDLCRPAPEPQPDDRGVADALADVAGRGAGAE